MREFGLDECEVLGETEIQVMVAKRLMLIAGNDDATTNDDKGDDDNDRGHWMGQGHGSPSYKYDESKSRNERRGKNKLKRVPRQDTPRNASRLTHEKKGAAQRR